MNLAHQLLQTRSVQIRPQEPFRLTSGRLSPVYVDVRRLISFPQIRTEITESFAKIAQERIGLSQIDVIAGGETAGIAYAALLAEKLNKPMIYVRKEPKGYGKSSQIEGVLEPGQRVLLVEDLVTDGGSKLNFQARDRVYRGHGASLSLRL
jgi:orotate phosphoribosyltransferase